MKNRRPGIIPTLYFLSILLTYPFQAFAAGPTTQFKSTVDRVIQVLTDPRLQGEGKMEERRMLLRQAVVSRFDFVEMARRSLGSHWQRRSSEERRQFVQVFADLLAKTYLGQIDAYNEKLIYTHKKIDEPLAEVETKIVTSKGEFGIDYKLHRVGNEWKVYDLVIENISVVDNYRFQFNRIIKKSSYDNLASRMEERLSETTGFRCNAHGNQQTARRDM